ncbi:dehydrogenase [Aerococcus urinaehominis]|uniref:Dehydrogenase n=1 Tax=Aerococcus urinaehominis TaxID=128944 RepID=A0A0X8FKP1_9LACT|nr:Gfo/Idh/MocA family oxidoreductase [Aerococcus urinaehominis]AMB99077.1 dehydrogenase [Aerococcus urinaehominis]SDM02777.1 Predicted dehydrogenase [Aerococcus urinaehominis]
MAEKKLRLGIIGYGTQGSAYGRFIDGGLVPSVELTGVCDIDPAAIDRCKELFPEVNAYEDYKDLVDSGEVDAVITAVPHYLHPEMAIYALSKDIHVLNEKPAGVYTKQVQELNEYAKDAKATYAIMFNQRNNPLYQKIKAIMDSGDLGAIRRTNWIITTWWRPQAYYNQSEWRATWGGEGGGVLVNQAPHQLDLFQWIAGVPESVYAMVDEGYQRDIVVEDQVHAMLKYPNGATGVFVTSTNEIVGSDRLEIYCDKGKIVVDDSQKATVYRLKETEQDIDAGFDADKVKRMMAAENVFGDLFEEVQTIEEENVWGAQHSGVIENFAQHILNGEDLIAPGAEGINGVRLANAIQMSGWTGEKISIKDFDDDKFLEMLNQHIEEEGKFPTRD